MFQNRYVLLFLFGLIGSGLSYGQDVAFPQPIERIVRHSFEIVGAISIAEGSSSAQEIAHFDDALFEDVDPTPTFGFSTATHFIKLRIFNPGVAHLNRILEISNPILNRCNLYEIRNGKAHPLYLSGDDLPFAERPRYHSSYQFPIAIAPETYSDYLLEVSSGGEQLQVPIALRDLDELSYRDQGDRLKQGFYFGILGFVLLFNLFLYVIIRERSSLYYVIYVAALLVLQLSLSGLAFQYLWPESSYLANIANPLFASLSIFALIRFTQLFLNLQSYFPRLNKVYTGMGILVAANMLLSLVYHDPFFHIAVLVINCTALLLNFLIIPTVIAVWRKKFAPARYFLFAFVALVICVFLFILNNFGVFKSEFFALYGLQIGSAIEVILLSFAIVDRFKSFREDALESLITINNMKTTANEELERKVVTRTREISEAKLEVEKQKQEIVDSIRYAERIQKSLLPSGERINQLFHEHFILFQPRDIVSGDFYWFGENSTSFPWRGRHLRMFAAVDCTGHGVPGAMMSVLGYNGLEQCITRPEVNSPGKALRFINNEIIRVLQAEKKAGQVQDGMDMVFCAFDPAQQILHFAGAKNDLHILRDGAFITLRGDRNSIGTAYMEADQCFEDHSIALQPGDRVYTFTDGLADQFGGKRNKKLKSKTLLDWIAEVSECAMDGQREQIQSAFEKWRGANEQVDDVCLIGFKF